MPDRRHHPQVKRAVEWARAAGIANPWARINYGKRGYEKFMDAAFEEHFARVAVDGIYWDHHGSFYTERWDVPYPSRDEDCHAYYGRCKSGSQWFWYVHAWIIGDGTFSSDALREHGWAEDEAQALVNGTAAIKQFAAGRRVIAQLRHGFASDELKQINKDKRTAQWRPTDTNSNLVEYLYSRAHHDGEIYLYRFQIAKRTAKRVYYLRKEELIDEHGGLYETGIEDTTYNGVVGFVDRQQLEAEGFVWSNSDGHLYASLSRLLAAVNRYIDPGDPVEKPDLKKLKAEMVAAHPDKGRSSAAFIAARAAYEEALETRRRDR